MATPSRNALLTKLQKTLKKHYKPVEPPARPVLENLLFACVLEDTHYGPAEESLRALQATFFDWNEVRVSTVKELAEVLSMLPDPAAAATRLKRVLQGVFEDTYSFELESLKKQNLGAAVKRLEKFQGTDSFIVAYAVQTVLGGHAIPLSGGVLDAALVLGLITPAERSKNQIPGLERAVPKSRGVEFGSLVHQLGADFVANPYGPELHKLLLEVNPECKDRLPKRLTKKQKEAAEAEAAVKAAEAKAERIRKLEAARKREAAKLAVKKTESGKPAPGAASAKKPAESPVKPSAKKKEAAPARGAEAKPVGKAKESPAKAKEKEHAKPKEAAKSKEAPAKPAAKPPEAAKRKSPSATLAKRKPR